MNTHLMTRKVWRIAAVGLLAVCSASFYVAQDRTPVPTAQPAPSAAEHRAAPPLAKLASRPTKGIRLRDWSVNPDLDDYRVVVLPAQRGFHDLEAALRFSDTQSARAPVPTVILLDAGIYTGNFVLPPGGTTYIIGREGRLATTIEGSPGVNLPAVRFSPVSGPLTTEAILVGITVRGYMQSAVQFVGSTSDTRLGFDECFLFTEANIPAISWSGSGYGSDERMNLDLWDSEISSEGDGIVANVGNHVGMFSGMGIYEAAGVALDFQCGPADDNTEVILFQGATWGDRALRITNLGHLWSGGVFLNSNQTTVTLTNVSETRLEQAEVHSGSSHAVELSGSDLEMEYMRVGAGTGAYGVRAVSSSNAFIAFCNFSTDSSAWTTYVDASCTETLAFNHWRYLPLP